VPANAAAWLVGVGLVFAAMAPTTAETPAALIGLAARLGGVAMAATVALVTGTVLVRLRSAGERSPAKTGS
jgi:hypothetical protein